MLDQSYKIESLRQFYSMSSHAEIIRSDALNSLLNGNVRVSAKIDILYSIEILRGILRFS